MTRKERPELRRGFTLVELSIVIAVVAVIAAIAIPNLLVVRKHGNESAAVENLRAIANAETMFREGDRERDGNLDYGMLSELSSSAILDSVLGNGTKQGYLFQASYSFATSEFLWFATASPAAPGYSGDRYFAINQLGVVYYRNGAAFPLDTNGATLPVSGAIPASGRGSGGSPAGARGPGNGNGSTATSNGGGAVNAGNGDGGGVVNAGNGDGGEAVNASDGNGNGHGKGNGRDKGNGHGKGNGHHKGNHGKDSG